MELADLVLAPSSFVQWTIQQFTDKQVAFAPYGVDLESWYPAEQEKTTGPLKFIYAGQCSLRKGIPVLLQAWRDAQMKDAQLELVGSWHFAEEKKRELPDNVIFTGPVSPAVLRERYQSSDVFVFPSFFEGFGLVLLEAMACGLPVITTDATAGPDIVDNQTGQVVPVGNVDALTDSLRWFADHRDRLPEMRKAARTKAETFTWENYRRCVCDAVASFSGEH
jgi:glycosyltransferase involved in cell wall biosynthesis